MKLLFQIQFLFWLTRSEKRLDGVDLRIVWPNYGEEITTSLVYPSIKLDVTKGSDAEFLRMRPEKWFVCFEARGNIDSRRCLGVASNELAKPLHMDKGDHIIDAWVQEEAEGEKIKEKFCKTSVYIRVKPYVYISGCHLAMPCAFDEEVLISSQRLRASIAVHHRLHGIFSDGELRLRLAQGYNITCQREVSDKEYIESCVNELIENTIRVHIAPRCGCYQLKHRANNKLEIESNWKPKLYLINLDRRPDRLAYASSQLDKEGKDSQFQFIRIPAIDGASYKFSVSEMTLFRNADFLVEPMWSSMDLVRRLMANLLSHQLAWSLLIDSGEPAAIIFQDDLRVDQDNFGTKVMRIVESALKMNAWVIWLAANRGVHQQWESHPINATTEMYAAHMQGVRNIGQCIPELCQPCSGAYILTREGALRLKEMVIERGFEHQTDIWMNKILLAHNRHWISIPLLATTMDTPYFGSDVFLFSQEEIQRKKSRCIFQDFESPQALAYFARKQVIDHGLTFTDKFEHHGYQAAYWKYLRQLSCRREPTYRILEIGLGYSDDIGTSAIVWRSLFGPEASLDYLELENSIAIQNFLSTHRGIINNLFIGDQRTRRAFEPILQQPQYDIIIDDGGHCAECMINTLKILIHKLKPGGIFFLEDAHVWYSPDFNPPPIESKNISNILQFLNELQRDQLCLAVQAVCPLLHPEISKLISSIDCMREICIITRTSDDSADWHEHYGPCSGTRRCDCYRTDAPPESRRIFSCIREGNINTTNQNKKRESSSISDTPEYTDFVQLAVQDDTVFSQFKSHPSYHVLEHIRPECGELYVLALKHAHCDHFLKLPDPNVKIGSPRTYISNLLEGRRISPTTLRYLKVACDLDSLFPLRDAHLVEIGVGYGGQIQALHNTGLGKVTLVDLPPVQRLAQKYLNETAPHLNIHSWQMDNQKQVNDIDILISNYAFSELSLETQNIYFEALIKPAKRGYLTITPLNGYCQQWPLTNLFRILTEFGKNVYVANEVPLSWWQHQHNGPETQRPRNTIFLWGLPQDEPNILAFVQRWSHDHISSFFPHQVNFTAPICQLSWLSSSPDYGVDYSPYLTQKQQHDIAISSTSPPRTSSSRSATAATGAAPSPPIVHAFEFGDGGEVKHL